jgi:hypothetical protein
MSVQARERGVGCQRADLGRFFSTKGRLNQDEFRLLRTIFFNAAKVQFGKEEEKGEGKK